MPIVKRTALPAVDSDGDEIDIPTEGGVDFSQINTELSERELTEYRFFSYDLGNAGMQPHPKQVPVSTLLAGVQCVQNTGRDGRIEEFYRNRVRSPLTAIRAFCVLNEGGPKAASNCKNVTCPIWPFRQGRNAYYGRRGNAEPNDQDR